MDSAKNQKNQKKKVTRLECNLCSKIFSNRFNLKRHMKRIHELGIYVKLNLCQFCGSTFTTSDNLERHIFNLHQNEEANRRKRNNETKCPLCDHVNNRKLLLEHLANTHEVDVSIEQLSFPDYDSFERWKVEFEKSTTSSYTKSHTKKEKNKITHFFRCHRDGFHRSKINRIRNLKTLGSNKINGHCPARIDVTIKENNEILVNLMKTHIGHDMEIRRLKLTKTEKQSITEQLLSKTPLDIIIKNMKSKYSSERLQLLTKKDIFNIAHKLNVKTISNSTLKDWVNENEEFVRYFKQQGEEDNIYGLSDKDFLLVIMNDVQKELLKKCGRQFVCVDQLTKSTNFHFGIFIFLDNLQELVLCTLVFSNRSDTHIVKIVLEIIRNTCGEIKTEILMSDLSDSVQFYEAWNNINGPTNYYMFCPWRIEENFKTNIAKLIDNKHLRSELSKNFCSLLKVDNILEFDIKFREFLSQIKSSVCFYKFQQYFAKTFENSPHSWAKCFVPQLNKKLELALSEENCRFDQSKLKTIKQVDGIINMLMKLNRNKLLSSKYLIETDNTVDILRTTEFHMQSQSFRDFSIYQEENKWNLEKENEKYIVETIQSECHCIFQCPYCHICWHSYVCSCYESCIGWNMCEHIHTIGTYLRNSQDIVDTHQDHVYEEEEDEKTTKICLEAVNFMNQKQNLDLEKEMMEGILKNELINEFSKEIDDLKTKEEYEVIKKLISFVGPALDAVRNNQASLNSLTLYF